MKHITLPQLAKIMGVSRVTIYRKVKSGEISATRIGHAYVIEDKEISRILEKKPTKADKKRIAIAVKKTVIEYGEALKLLGNE
ncbi:MAG: hypothetical protein AMJ43_06505 [Coxiella sp. DG_40]|nr:MAG: hypothetical protein AMJ43_06505 [Coxiella sp. DG_40]